MRIGNVWFDYGRNEFLPGVLASVNNVVLMDRRTIQTSELSDLKDDGGPYRWIVYDSTDTKWFGEWTGYKTRKAAITAFVRRAMRAPAVDYPKSIVGTIAEPEWDERIAHLASLMSD